MGQYLQEDLYRVFLEVLPYFFMQKILFPSAKGIVFQTKDAQSWFSEKVQKKSEIIMNQVERDFFETKHECEAYYCAVGRLAEQKN